MAELDRNVCPYCSQGPIRRGRIAYEVCEFCGAEATLSLHFDYNLSRLQRGIRKGLRRYEVKLNEISRSIQQHFEERP